MDSSTDKSFLGTGWGFPPDFSARDRSVEMVSHEEDIRQSLKILFSTQPGERVMVPAYGCGLRVKVFDSITESMVTEIRDLIERAVLFFEPRITLEEVTVEIDDVYEGRVFIHLFYTVRATNTRSNMVYPFYFLEATLAPLEERQAKGLLAVSAAGVPTNGDGQ
jgi:phage baseplate assembly protein W